MAIGKISFAFGGFRNRAKRVSFSPPTPVAATKPAASGSREARTGENAADIAEVASVDGLRLFYNKKYGKFIPKCK